MPHRNRWCGSRGTCDPAVPPFPMRGRQERQALCPSGRRYWAEMLYLKGVTGGIMSAHCCAHGHHDTPDDREPEGFRRVLWAALCINATLFLIEIAAGLAAGSASLQADALDFLGDTGNYAISLFVIGKALRYRSLAALAKGGTMGVLGLWVIATAFWHALHGTLPGAETMGAVGF